ncbi:MAG: GNAT family N-acetyltransferase [bacterium]|nr:GNAT family N-acetyltransferase [bacterium]
MIETGAVITTFTTKNGSTATLRYPSLSDAPALLEFINTVSQEDSFIRFSGEQQTLQEEEEYVRSELEQIKNGDAVKIFCFVDSTLAGVCDIHRDVAFKKRKLHVGFQGIIIAKGFRGQGIGQELMSATIAEAQQHIPGLKHIRLECFSTNTAALALYAKLGFVEVGRLPGELLHRGQYIDEVVLIKPLE